MAAPSLRRGLLRPAYPLFAHPPPISHSTRPFSTNPSHRKGTSPQDGSHARRDPRVEMEYPGNDNVPKTSTVPGRGGPHFKRTLAHFSMEGKTVIVTGGARGLGLVMSQGLVESGAEVAICDLNRQEAEKQADELIRVFQRENPDGKAPKVTGHYCDVSSPHSIDDCLSAILSAHTKVDSLVTSAGFTENFRAETYPHDRLQKLWGVNVDGTYLWGAAVAKHLMSRNAAGSMVFIGSMSGAIVNVPQPQAPYNAAKAAVRHLAASFAVEWADKGIRVNCIAPGYMLTALTKKILDEKPELKEKWLSLIPAGRMGDPEDLMGAVVFLLSDASKYVTGAELRVDGGYTVT